MPRAWTYILKCADDSYYTGSTTDLERRLSEHKQGEYDGYAIWRRPILLVWHEEFPDPDQAFAVERQIKGWSRRKKEALIVGDFALLHELAACTNETSSRNINSRKTS